MYNAGRSLRLIQKTTDFWDVHVQEVVQALAEGEPEEDRERVISNFSWGNWKWAMSIVSSRSSFVPLQGLSIVHMAEMFNHRSLSPKHRPEKIVDDNGDFVIESRQIYPKNAQLFFDYALPNSELLLLHGFIDEQFRHDSVGLPFGVDPRDIYYEEKVAFLRENNWQYVL